MAQKGTAGTIEQYEAPQAKMEEINENLCALGGNLSSIQNVLADSKAIEMDTTVQDFRAVSALAASAPKLTLYKAKNIPSNLITEDCTDISPEKLPLINISQADIDAIVSQVPGGVANIQDIYGLTPLQNDMLYHNLMAKDGDKYLHVSRWRFIDWASLERYANAMQKLIERYDILRTAFFCDGLNEPAQVVLRKVPPLLSEITLNESGEPILEQLNQKFHPHHYRLDLTRAPLLCLQAASEADGCWVALQLMHHLIIDHSTLQGLHTEIYGIMNGKTESLITTPFRNFVAHTRFETSPAKHTRFFIEMLGDIDEPTLPFGLNFVDQDRCEINEAHLKLSKTLNDQLRAHARNLQISLSSICHLAWAQVLAMAGGRETVVFGQLQTRKGSDTNMGPTMNTLPIRLNIDERSVECAMRDTHARLSAFIAHEHASSVLARRCSGVSPDLTLFSAQLNYRYNPRVGKINTTLPGVSFLGIVDQTIHPLTLSVDENDSSLNILVQVVSPLSAGRICAYLQQSIESLINALVHTPYKSIRKLAVMPSNERNLLLHKWNQTTQNASLDCCLHQLFEAQVECDEQAIAVECDGQTMTYSDLNIQANCLANYLIAQSVKPDDRIALCVDRSTAMIVAMLGILKAGCAYVPLDAVYSSQRLSDILLDANPSFLIADSSGLNALEIHQVPVIELEKLMSSNLPIEDPNITELGLTPAHLAYVIYTSGSTGTPKGVMVEHRQAVRLFKVTHEKFDFNKHDKWSLFHSISFDFSVWEIWGALTSGSQLSIVPYKVTRYSNELYDWICTCGIIVLNQTSSAFKMLLRTINMSKRSDRLRYVIFGGEALDPLIPKEWYEKYGTSNTILFNMYGVTEITVHATYHRLEASKELNSIGRPLADLQVYLLDSNGKPVLLGGEGEIYIGGSGVARGYLNRPELNMERFIPDPFNVDPESRMYRTGDLARYLPDGDLVFLGRVDQQVKIRGFRIELGEIEARLIEHPQVHDASVQPFGDGLDKRLVAYVVAASDELLAQNLRTYLSKLLPDYMIPAAFVCLPSLPLTASGKLDRRALPAPDDEAFARQQYEAPQGKMEEKLAEIWSDLLNIDRVSRHDNFFALGGHSLLVVELLSKLRRTGLDTNLKEVYDAKTLASLALKLSLYKADIIPPNLITEDSTEITPKMLPLITLSQANIDAIIAQVPGGAANIQDIYGLTPLQNGMLYHHLMSKEGDTYLTASRLHFNDCNSLEQYAVALQQVIERHDVLRTAIFWDGLSEPAQVVLRKVPSPRKSINFDESRLHPPHYRLDLTRAPLLLLMVSPGLKGKWVAVQLMHHLIIDNSALNGLHAEIHAIMDGRVGMLTTPTPFRNFMAQTRFGTSPAEHTRFFTEMLSDIDEPTLPFDLSDVDQEGSDSNEAYLDLPQTLNDQLRVQARNLQVSLASICHLAWAQVLAKASAQKTVVFGTVLFGRLQSGEGNNNIMGPMINTLPIRLNVDGRGVEAAVRDTHAQLSSLLSHENAPLVLAQRCSGVPFSSPLFSALLNYRHNQKTEERSNMLLPGASVIDVEEKTNYPITLAVEDNINLLGLTAQVVPLLSAARICAYMQQALESLIDAVTHTPQSPVRKLRVMPPNERFLLLHSWNQAAVNISPICCLHQLFESQVESDGYAIAVECKGQILNYSELNAQANRLAHHLISEGVKPDDRIALCIERSEEMIVAILGILKAGCAYVPLDPAYPSQRLGNILMDADPIFLLADKTCRKLLGNHGISVIDIEIQAFSCLAIENPESNKLGLTPAHLAYIIYTSGSTGTPKGVMVEHQQIVPLFEAKRYKLGFNTYDRWCLFHSISFDVSVWEMWGALLYGSKLLIPTYNITRSMDDLYDWICSTGVTVLNQTPSAYKMLMRARNMDSRSDNLRIVIFGGEEMDQSVAMEWYKKYNKCDTILTNLYGPTEAIITATSWIFDINILKNLTPPIGCPLTNKRIYLLDAHGDPVLLGVKGEIYIGGGVARGYLNQPELTTERFLSDPFSEISTARMYRTGDLARYLIDGNLVFLGRVDQQIKIRGFRIEPGEIEARLLKHPQVHEAVVQPCGNGQDARLVAYVVADADTSLAQNLRKYLSTQLPDYMIPAAYVCLPSLPLTSNGKLDRRALPTPNDEAFARQQYEAPQTKMEEKLTDIWRELLQVDRISRHDNFFALGGHSLLVVELLSKLRQIGLDTNVREVYDAKTLASLASILTRYKAVTVPPNLITEDSTEITPEMLPLINLTQADIGAIIANVPGGVANIRDIYGLTPLQSGMLYHHLMSKEGDSYLNARQMHFNDYKLLEQYADAMQQVAERHDVLRTAIFWDGLSESAQVVLRQVPSILTEIKIDDFDTSALEQLKRKFNPSHHRLDLTQAPLLRLLAAPEYNGSWVAVQFTHHLIMDHSTVERLQAQIYAIMNGKTRMLAPSSPFRHYVAQIRLGISLAEHMRFFTEMLGDIDEPTLPFGLSDVGQEGSESNEAYLDLPQTLNDQLRIQARNLQVSLASICHLAWAQVLAKASAQKTVVFGTVLLGRLQSGEGNNSIMGPMINTLPIRLNVDGRSVEAAVRDTHARLSSLLTHEHAPLVLAQRCSKIQLGLPLFSALLNYRHNGKNGEEDVSLPGIHILDNAGKTNYPLALSLDDDDESLCFSVEVMSPISATLICAYIEQAFKSLIDALTHTTNLPVQKLSVIPPDKRDYLLHSWNQATLNISPVRCLHQLFEAQVECDGHAIAVECNGQTMTFSDLNIQANCLAHYLINKGVNPDDRIALCVERSTAMTVAILGILKAGCAYVPLDPVYSSQRLTNILMDAEPLFLLTDAAGRVALGDHKIPNIDLGKPLLADLAISNPDTVNLGLTPSHLAYVIYTFGSTGTPKGVMVEHQQIVPLFEAKRDKFGFTKHDNWCSFHSISFDVSVWEMWGALSYGSKLLIPTYNITRSMDDLYEWICINDITVLEQTSSTFKMLMRAKSTSSRSDRLRIVIFGGEALDPTIVAEWYEKHDTCGTILVNMYGPTEAVITATTWICDVEVSKSLMSPIGRPLSNKRIYLLDPCGEPVPLGAEGEIYIGGAGVARGYLNRPELTVKRFLPDPFSGFPISRMYRTGDLGRYLPDGNLVFLGRVDQQVKIRGFRIELGEIEARLIEHPQVHDASVQPFGDGLDKQLVAYVVAASDDLLAQNLRTYLSKLLPDYMIPAAYVCLPSLPLTTSGKLDRRALPAPADEAFARQQYEAPQSRIEEKLAEIWSELLNIDQVSRHDNFFELGGHSLLVMHLINRAKLYNIQIDARGVFSFPILKALAEQIINRANKFYCDAAIPARQCGNETPMFVLPDGDGDMSYAFELARDIDKNIPVYVLPWPSPENKQPSSLEDMAKAIIPLIEKVKPTGPYGVIGYSSGGTLAIEITKQLMNSGYPVRFLGLIDTYADVEQLSETELTCDTKVFGMNLSRYTAKT